MSTCLHLLDIKISNCPLLSNESFMKSKGLKKLKNLDISYCSNKIIGNIFEKFPSNFCSINLDGIQVKNFLPLFLSLEITSTLILQKLSCKYCPFFESKEVDYVITHFPYLTEFNFHGSPCAIYGKFENNCDGNSLLDFRNSVETDFVGYFIPKERQRKIRQFVSVRNKIIEHKAARVITVFFHLLTNRKKMKNKREMEANELLLSIW